MATVFGQWTHETAPGMSRGNGEVWALTRGHVQVFTYSKGDGASAGSGDDYAVSRGDEIFAEITPE